MFIPSQQPKINPGASYPDRIPVAPLIIILGCILYIILFIIATFYYPGGSQINPDSKGFSWIDNYWCNLLNPLAINKSVNVSRPIALAALLILTLTLGIFWYSFPKEVSLPKKVNIVVGVSVILVIVSSFLLFIDFLLSDFHDTIINLISLAGLVATTGTFITLYTLKWSSLLWFGVFNLILIVVNNILYYGQGLMIYLPVVQKITFLSFLIWIILIEVRVLKRWKNKVQNLIQSK